MLDKDEILEDLFNEKGIGDVLWRSTLSRTADEILRQRASQSDSSIIVSWWRHPASTLVSGTPIEWLSDLPGVLIEISCICDPAIAVERFKSRIRHRGHLDQFKSSADLLASFQQQAALGPLGIGHLIEVNTEATVELTDLLAVIDFFTNTGVLNGPDFLKISLTIGRHHLRNSHIPLHKWLLAIHLLTSSIASFCVGAFHQLRY